MIPKIIHYCWMSDDPIPETLKGYMESWKKLLPDYEFILWNYQRFPRGKSKWVDSAFDKKKYAFCADYIRLYALFHYGGIYLDSDVEVIKDFDDLLDLNTMVCNQNKLEGLELAAFGTENGCGWIKCLLEEYDRMAFINKYGRMNDEPMPYVVDDILERNGYKKVDVTTLAEALNITDEKEIPVFSSDFFSPLRFLENKMDITENTYCIHHFVGSWTNRPKYELAEQRFWNRLGLPNKFILTRILNVFTMRSNLWGNLKRQ